VSNFPFAHQVPDLKIGDTVFWDDRSGFEGKVTALPTPTTLDVEYLEDIGYGSGDKNIDRKMFTVKRP